MTTFKQFMDEIEIEAQQEGPQAIEELEDFKQHFGKQRDNCQDQSCLMDAFFRRQQELPPAMRSNTALLYCPCRRCNSVRL